GPPSGRQALADVTEVASDALALVRPQKEWKGVDVNIDIAQGLHVRLSPQRLTQGLLNLRLNAGAVLYEKRSDATRTVTVRAKLSGEARARIEVEDNGD